MKRTFELSRVENLLVALLSFLNIFFPPALLDNHSLQDIEGPGQSSMPFSPMHIPDEEAMEMAGRLSPPSSPIPSVLDLASDIQSPM